MMLKLFAITLLAAQVMGLPSYGFGMGMNPWMNQWGGAGGWLMGPWQGAVSAPPVPNLPTFGKTGMSIGALYKQLGMAEAVIGSKIKIAQDEVKSANDELKEHGPLDPKDPCSPALDAANVAAANIDNEVKTAFDACQMKEDFKQLRMQSLTFKQQMAAFKIAKKACKLEAEPVACLNEATAAAGSDPADVATTLADINAKVDDCIANSRQRLLAQVEAATDDLLAC